MRPRIREIADRKAIDGFLAGCLTARLGLISRSEPYVVPVNFVYTEGTVFFHCGFTGRKQAALADGCRICIEFDETRGFNRKEADTFYTSVIAWGSPVQVKDAGEKERILGMLCRKYLGEERPISDTMVAGTCIVSVKLDTVTGKENRF